MGKLQVMPDDRGESEHYEAYTLVCLEGSRVVWVEGIQKDRTHMYEDIRTFVEAELTRLKGEQP